MILTALALFIQTATFVESDGRTFNCVAIRVVDGDTLNACGRRVRLSDIDAPEIRARCPAERILAERATRRLRQLLAAGPFEMRRLGRDRDRYGRRLRVVVRGGRSIGDQMVREGLARTWTGRRLPWC